jgi:3-phenylpropionate/cinnamic acid dioxygenase small subunit
MDSLSTQDRIAIQDVMLNYAAGVDDRNREQYANCFDENVEVVGFGDEAILGRTAWVDYVFEALEKYSASQHMLGPPLASPDGSRARVRTDVQALHYFANGEHQRFILWATYLSDMERRDDGWRIVRHELVTRGSQLD